MATQGTVRESITLPLTSRPPTSKYVFPELKELTTIASKKVKLTFLLILFCFCSEGSKRTRQQWQPKQAGSNQANRQAAGRQTIWHPVPLLTNHLTSDLIIWLLSIEVYYLDFILASVKSIMEDFASAATNHELFF